MICLFNRKELTVTHSDQRLYRLTAALSEAGIPYRTKYGGGSVFTADRYRGVPFLQSDTTHPHKIYVNRSDYDRALCVIGSVC